MISLKTGSNTAIVDGVEKKMDVPATVVNSRIMVPLRFIFENTGADVTWKDDENSVYIGYKASPHTVSTSYPRLGMWWLNQSLYKHPGDFK